MNILNIDIIKCINKYIKSPIDAINYLRVMEKYYRSKNGYVHPIIYDMLIERENFLLNHNANHVMCDTINCYSFGTLDKCYICGENLCYDCLIDGTLDKFIIRNKCMDIICGICYNEYCKNNNLVCTSCNGPLTYDIIKKNIVYNMCSKCGELKCTICKNIKTCIDNHYHYFNIRIINF